MKSSEIRQAFIDFFQKTGHQKVNSSPLIPANDPTLLFTNAGMVPFKETFLGIEKRSYTRAVSVQRCLRAGGKHNDLENVGYTARHHTFFEMLGNFSFGDYFKREAIHYSWDFLTKILKIPQEKLWVTVYTEDDGTANIWLKEMKVDPKRFSRCGEKDNFWSMGDTGPCGPCTEIFYDHGSKIPGGPPGSPDEESDRYIEIWNIVFMQYNRDKNGTLTPLPKPSVDTGMGLERIAAVVQGVHSNYEIDSFQQLIKSIQALGKNIDATQPSARVIADHIRACSFLITDGIIPSNEGRGYVLRRVIRRAVRHGNKLGLQSPFFHRLVKPLIDIMGDAYPELGQNQSEIERLLLQEEKQFVHTLEHGLRILQSEMKSCKNQEISGDVAFKLYDTYGFPLDLTADIAREQGLSINEAGFKECMKKQRQQSKANAHFSVDYSSDQTLDITTLFSGYDATQTNSNIVAVLLNGKQSKRLKTGDKGAILLDTSPFYAESGGQIGDTGEIIAKTGTFHVTDTQKSGQAIIHYGEMTQGTLETGQSIVASVNTTRRNDIRLNHTATHLLHAALKSIVGPHVQQKGSLVGAERARFDFSHHEALTPKQLRETEALVNLQIRCNYPVQTQIMSMDDAQKDGAVALFGEKYSDEVRVLSMGAFSKELCGGTHAKHTGDIGLFKIVSEYGTASGIRRIEMLTGSHALTWVNQELATLNALADTLKTKPDQALEKLNQMITNNKQAEKTIAQFEQKAASKSSSELISEVKKFNQVNLLVKRLDHLNGQALRALLDQLKSNVSDAVIVLLSVSGDKISVVAGISKSLIGKVPPAADYVRHLCGKGGGRADMAQGGGSKPDDLDEKLNAIEKML